MPSDFFGRIIYILQNYGMSYLDGAITTMKIAVVSTLIGCVIGFAVGVVQTIPTQRKKHPIKWVIIKFVQGILAFYVEFFRGTPMMAQAMFMYFGLSMVTDIQMSMISTAYLIVSINTGAYMAETVRGGILSVDEGQTEGAKAIGMNHLQTMVNVVLPQALRNIMPQIGNNLIINIKDTCVLVVIGTVELMYVTKGVSGALYAPFEAYAIVMVVYFILTFVCSRILRFIENRMDGEDNYDLATAESLTHTSGLHTFDHKAKQRRHTNKMNKLDSDMQEGGS